MHTLGMTLMSHIAEGLGKPKTFFHKWFEHDTCSTLRLQNYLPRDNCVIDSSKLSPEQQKYTTSAHTDGGFMTILSTFHYPGLQVEVIDGVFKSVRPLPNALIVNLGDSLSKISSYKLKATRHQVLDIFKERYSSPFFFEPCFLAKIPPSLDEQDEAVINAEPTYGEFIIEKCMRLYGEFKNFRP